MSMQLSRAVGRHRGKGRPVASLPLLLHRWAAVSQGCYSTEDGETHLGNTGHNRPTPSSSSPPLLATTRQWPETAWLWWQWKQGAQQPLWGEEMELEDRGIKGAVSQTPLVTWPLLPGSSSDQSRLSGVAPLWQITLQSRGLFHAASLQLAQQ